MRVLSSSASPVLAASQSALRTHLRNRWSAAVCGVALAVGLACSSPAAHAQSDASLMLSALPVASVVVVGSAAAGASAALVTIPVALSVDGAVLIVKGVKASAKGTVLLLERASDGAVASIELASGAVSATVGSVGTAIVVSVIGAGVLLSAAGEVIAIVPNEIGKALLYNECL